MLHARYRWLCVILLRAMIARMISCQVLHNYNPVDLANRGVSVVLEHYLQMLVNESTPDPFLVQHGSVPPAAWGSESLNQFPPPSNAAISLTLFTKDAIAASREWLSNPVDNDKELECRLDGRDDEVGRVQDALRTRLAVAKAAANARHPTTKATEARQARMRILFDARCLQDAAYAGRGIGVYAKAALAGLTSDKHDVVLLVDPVMQDLKADFRKNRMLVTTVTSTEAGAYAAIVQPSPLTHSPDPLLPLLERDDVLRVAVVFDFIPKRYPGVYLPFYGERAAYAAALDALLHLYDHYIPISRTVAAELDAELQAHSAAAKRRVTSTVAIPDAILHPTTPAKLASQPAQTFDVVVMTGMEHRKNTLAALAAITLVPRPLSVAIVGMAAFKAAVQQWCAAVGLPPDRVHISNSMSNGAKQAILARAGVVVVPSLDEGLSLPVIEGVLAGAPVVASDIPSHRELIGSGDHLAPPTDVRAFAAAIDRHLNHSDTRRRQAVAFADNAYSSVEHVVSDILHRRSLQSWRSRRSWRDTMHTRRLNVQRSIGIVTPWPPQKSGIADFTRAVVLDLVTRADVTVYVTSDAGRDGAEAGVRFAPVSVLLDAAPGDHSHDALLAVIGNNFFHLPALQVARRHESYIVLHDTCLAEVYMALRGEAGLQALMSKALDADEHNRQLSISDQMQDANLLQNTATFEVARLAKRLIVHAPLAAGIIQKQTGVKPVWLPFVVYLSPPADVGPQAREEARQKLGFSHDCVHISTFGELDDRRKRVYDLLEACAILSERGHKICLHFIGNDGNKHGPRLLQQARGRIGSVEVVEFVPADKYVDYMLATDLGVQLRYGPFVGPSGALTDIAAMGTQGVGSTGIAVESGAPDYIDRVPEGLSPECLAKVIEQRLVRPYLSTFVETQRLAYLDRASVPKYNTMLLQMVEADVSMIRRPSFLSKTNVSERTYTRQTVAA